MKNKEIEIKLLFSDKKKIVSKLEPRIRFLKSVKVLDKYYSFSNFIKNKSDFFRIRIIDKKAELTYKGRSKNKNGIIKKTELTSEISSSEAIEVILKKAGLEKRSEHRSEKEYWALDDIEIVFVKFIKPAKLIFMEIEGPSKNKIENVLKKIEDCVSIMEESDFNVFDRADKKTI
jgi:adenylate cyclase class IV